MPALAPLKLTLYDPETSEMLGEYICNFVSLRYLKLAIRLSKSLVNINTDTLTGLILDLFGNQFSATQLIRYTEPKDRMAILQALINRGGFFTSKPSKNEASNKNSVIDLENELTDLEISLIKAFPWSLQDLDETDIESLFPFVARFSETNDMPATVTLAYCDQVSWL